MRKAAPKATAPKPAAARRSRKSDAVTSSSEPMVSAAPETLN
jgi:hypothetical protein